MIHGASVSHRPAARRSVLGLLFAFSVLTGELALAGHHAWLDHGVPYGHTATLVASCSICDHEAARPAEASPSSPQGAVTPLPPTTQPAPMRAPDVSTNVPSAGPAAPRAPPTYA